MRGPSGGRLVHKGLGGIRVPGNKTHPFRKDSRMEGDTGRMRDMGGHERHWEDKKNWEGMSI